MEFRVDKNPVIAASEINNFVYCPMAFFLKRAGMALERYEPDTLFPSAARVYPGYVMQLIAYCALVEEVYGRTPSHGILVLKDGKKEKVDFTEHRRQELISVLAKMRGMLDEGAASQDFAGMRKCKTCSYGTLCEELVDLSGCARYYT